MRADQVRGDAAAGELRERLRDHSPGRRRDGDVRRGFEFLAPPSIKYWRFCGVGVSIGRVFAHACGLRRYIVASGQCQALVAAGGGAPTVIKQYGRGEYFGEVALLSGGRRAASVAAVGRVVCYRVRAFHPGHTRVVFSTVDHRRRRS